MRNTIQRRRLLLTGAALGAGLLAGPARACEYFSSSLRIYHPWTRATPQDAPYAVVCLRFDEVTQDDRLIRVETPVAERIALAGMPETGGIDLAIAAGQTLEFTETGVHLRLFGLQHALEVARSYPMLLGFERGGVVQATINVDYARFS